MARRRMIDPNFWQSEDIGKLSIRQRLLFIGLFSNADDEGKLRGNPAFVRSIIFPYEDFTLGEIESDLIKIEAAGSITQYEVEGSKYILVRNWRKFQRVDKPQPSVIPNPQLSDSKNDSWNESENDSRLKESNISEFKVKGKESSSETDTYTGMIQILNLYCEMHQKIDIHVSEKERDEMTKLSNIVPIDFALEKMRQLFDYKKSRNEKVTSFHYYPEIIKDAYKKQIGGDQHSQHEGSTQGIRPGSYTPTSASESITGGQLGWIGKGRNNVVSLPNVQG